MQYNVTTDLATIRQDAIVRLRAACARAIESGFVSSALGSPHLYPSTKTDQINLMASVSDAQGQADPGWTTPFTAVPIEQAETPEWPLIDHDARQIRAAGADGKAWILAQRIQLRALAPQVQAATTAAEIWAVVWTDGVP